MIKDMSLGKMPKKICFILPNYFYDAKGGSELQAIMLAEEFAKRGWIVAYIREKNSMVGNVESYRGIHIYSLPRRKMVLKWLNTFHLLEIMRRISADVWYCRGSISYVFPVWLCSKSTKGKVVWACSHDSQVSKSMKKSNRPIRRLVYDFFYSLDKLLFLFALKRINLTVLQTEKQKNMLWENRHLKGAVVHNGYRLPILEKVSREPVILWVGRLQPWKHPEKFVELVEILKDEHYKFIAAGREIEKDGFKEKFENLGKEVLNFKYLGEIEREEVLKLMRHAKLLVNTSDFEGFSNTFIEAWMFGVPVVSLKVDPDGFILKEKLGKVSLTMDQMVKDIKELMTNDHLWSDISKRCRTFAEKNLNIEDKAKELEKLILAAD